MITSGVGLLIAGGVTCHHSGVVVGDAQDLIIIADCSHQVEDHHYHHLDQNEDKEVLLAVCVCV